MSEVVLDASAVLALLNQETGSYDSTVIIVSDLGKVKDNFRGKSVSIVSIMLDKIG